MQATMIKGYKAVWLDGAWLWADNHHRVDVEKRPCIKCGQNHKNDKDACMGELPGVLSSCCGHGKDEGFILFNNGVMIRGHFRVEHEFSKGRTIQVNEEGAHRK